MVMVCYSKRGQIKSVEGKDTQVGVHHKSDCLA